MRLIREEIASDIPTIRRLNEEAFGQPTEADIVDRLRSSCDHLLSMVRRTGKPHRGSYPLQSSDPRIR
jgi:predicted N-acetyltransferase YhbS